MIAEKGRVFSFEPSAANLRYLREHLRLNDVQNVSVIEALVGSSDQEATPFFEQPDAAGQNSIVIKRDRNQYVETRRRQICLDSFCRQHDLSPDVIKIDVEGSEIAVLKGARETIARCQPIIFLSVHPAQLELLGHTTSELATQIEELGYDCRDVDGRSVKRFALDEYVLTSKPNAAVTPRAALN